MFPNYNLTMTEEVDIYFIKPLHKGLAGWVWVVVALGVLLLVTVITVVV